MGGWIGYSNHLRKEIYSITLSLPSLFSVGLSGKLKEKLRENIRKGKFKILSKSILCKLIERFF